MTLSFFGPKVEGLLPAQIGAFIIGTAYSSIAKTNNAPILILMIRELVDLVFYQMASRSANILDSRKQAKIYAGTNFCVNMGTLFFMRHLNLIAKVGTVVYLAMITLEMAFKQMDFKNYSTIE